MWVVDADGQQWSITGDWAPETDISDTVIRAPTTYEAVKGIDFEHPRRCIARFNKRGVATIRFRASLIRDDGDPNPIEVQFSTSAPHEGDAAPNDEDGKSSNVEPVVVD